MPVWHVVVIFGVQALSSGRSAIPGYTMPIFTALVGAVVCGERLAARQWLGVAAAGVGVLLLLSEEFGKLAGAPWAAAAVVGAAAVMRGERSPRSAACRWRGERCTLNVPGLGPAADLLSLLVQRK